MASRQSTIRHEFIIKSELGKMQVPEHFCPGTFSEYSSRLVRIWASLMLELHMLYGNTQEFSVGFIFDEMAEALYERCSEYGTVFYINPAVVRFNSFGGRSLAKRWKLNSAGKFRLLMDAVHEYTHRQHGDHDEAYAGALTDNAAIAMQNLRRFHHCFRGKP